MEKRTETVEVFIAADGSRFMTAAECEAYEAAKLAHEKRIAGVTFWRLIHNPDLTEGRGHYGLTLIAVDGYPHGYPVKARVLKAATLIGGDPLQFVQGASPIEGWLLTQLQDDTAWRRRSEQFVKVGDYPHYASALFLSDGPAIDGWPAPATMADLKDKAALLAKVEKRERR